MDKLKTNTVTELSQHLELSLNDQQNRPLTDLAIILDESGSVGEKNFQIFSYAIESFLDVFPFELLESFSQANKNQSQPKTLASVFKFSDRVVTVQELTDQKQQIVDSIRNMQYVGGGTQTNTALRQAYEHLRTRGRCFQRNDCRGLICLFTDGDLGSDSKPFFHQINKCQNVDIVTIFIHFTPPARLAQDYQLSSSQVLVFPDFGLLRNVLGRFSSAFLEAKKTNSQPPIHQDLINTLKGCKILADVNHNPEIQQLEFVVVQEDHPEKIIFQKNLDASNPYYLIESENFPPKDFLLIKYRGVNKRGEIITDYTTNDEGKPWHRFNISDPIKEITDLFQRLNNLKDKPIEQQRIYDEHMMKAKSLIELNSRPLLQNLNFLLLGICGSGKSSTINTFVSLHNGEYIMRENSGNSSVSVTRQLKQVKLFGENSSQLRVFDMWGMEFSKNSQEDTYEYSNYANILDKILSGHIANGFNLNELKTIQYSQYLIDNPSINDRIHAIIIVVDMLSASEENYQKSISSLATAIQNYNAANGCNYKPLFLMTKFDIAVKNAKEQNSQKVNVIPEVKDLPQDYQILRQLVKNFANNTGTQEENIQVFSNQVHEGQMDLYRSILATKVLQIIKQRALAFVDDIQKNLYKIVIEEWTDYFNVVHQNEIIDCLDIAKTDIALILIKHSVEKALLDSQIFEGQSEMFWYFVDVKNSAKKMPILHEQEQEQKIPTEKKALTVKDISNDIDRVILVSVNKDNYTRRHEYFNKPSMTSSAILSNRSSIVMPSEKATTKDLQASSPPSITAAEEQYKIEVKILQKNQTLMEFSPYITNSTNLNQLRDLIKEEIEGETKIEDLSQFKFVDSNSQSVQESEEKSRLCSTLMSSSKCILMRIQVQETTTQESDLDGKMIRITSGDLEEIASTRLDPELLLQDLRQMLIEEDIMSKDDKFRDFDHNRKVWGIVMKSNEKIVRLNKILLNDELRIFKK